MGNSVSVSTINIGFASNGMIQALMMLKLSIITDKGFIPCVSQPIENPHIPAKCCVLNSWNRWVSASGSWQMLSMFRISVLTNWSIRSAALHQVRHCDWRSSLIYQRIIGSIFKLAGICIGLNNPKRTTLNLSQILIKLRNWLNNISPHSSQYTGNCSLARYALP